MGCCVFNYVEVYADQNMKDCWLIKLNGKY